MALYLQTDLVILIFKFYALMFILGPLALRATFRFKAKLDPKLISKESLPLDVQQFMAPRVKAVAGLNGFDLVGYIAVGSMAGKTQSFMALFSNPNTREWADVSVVNSGKKLKGYTEFITRCSDGSQVDTNTNPVAPVLSPSPSHHVFRFPEVRDVSTLYRVHRMLVDRQIGGAGPELPAKGQEVAELKRRLETYGRNQQERGYMYLERSEESYRLTWKGAILGAWRSIWPVSLVRNLWMHGRSQTQLRGMGVTQIPSA